MKQTFTFLFTLTSFSFAPIFGQSLDKKVMEPSVYEIWNTIENVQISANGQWIAYTLKPGKGDPTLALYDASNQETSYFPRSDKASFSHDGSYLLFTIHPPEDTLKAQRRRKVAKKDLPGDTLGIYGIANKDLTRVPNLKSVKLPLKWSNWVAYQTGSGSGKAHTLHMRELSSGKEDTLAAVSSYLFAEEGEALLASTEEKDSTQDAGVFQYNFQAKVWENLWEEKGKYTQLSLSRDGSQASFIADRDSTKAQVRPFELMYWKTGQDLAQVLLDGASSGIPDGYSISSDQAPTFSRDGKRLMFGIRTQPIVEDTTLLEEEKVQVEVWTYKDPLLYTQQEVRSKNEKKRSYKTLYDLESSRVVALSDREMPEMQWGDEGNGNWALGYSESGYQQEISWEGFALKDLHKVNMNSGKRELLAKAIGGYPQISPGGNYAYWYDRPDSSWKAMELATNREILLSSAIPTAVFDELNDRPMHPGNYGVAGWLEGDSHILMYDRYDIWKVDPENVNAPQNLTQGREEKTSYRFLRLDRDQRYIPGEGKILLHMTNEVSRQQGYAWLDVETAALETSVKGDFSFSRRPQKAREADKLVFTQENFQVFPDLQYSELDFANPVKISDANPQQTEYNWGTIELVEWTSLDGIPLQGMLVKPENFDPNKQYPMIVNFYERSSQGLHRHRAPSPGRSTINYSYYTSRGYVIFNPDVVYRRGYPGESAYNCVIPGVTKLRESGFIDPERIGVQGHSWGGYQIAYLLTRTNIFRAAESGAPVVNMFSAYGGIRWGSGMSRMFQYERTQSRIGGTIWEYPLRYVENSPIFTLDKIQTPVLILHNDEDTAVPWYQGIEFFVGMRRLGKPAWLLNYNGEPHWPVKLQNRVDFNLRMSQFFDHYLKDAPMPMWMEKGVSPLQKGIEQGYELEGRP